MAAEPLVIVYDGSFRVGLILSRFVTLVVLDEEPQVFGSYMTLGPATEETQMLEDFNSLPCRDDFDLREEVDSDIAYFEETFMVNSYTFLCNWG